MTSTFDELTSYPPDLLASPLDHQAAAVRAEAGSGHVTRVGGGRPGALGDHRGRWVHRRLHRLGCLSRPQCWLRPFALAIAVALGALHAFAPGHGKTLMAAYMLGRQQSSLQQVALIGLTVTLTHTAGVLLLGIALSALALTAPDKIYSWLGLASGLLLVAIGVSLLHQARRVAAPRAEPVQERERVSVTPSHDHEHLHEHEHTHDHDIFTDTSTKLPRHEATSRA